MTMEEIFAEIAETKVAVAMFRHAWEPGRWNCMLEFKDENGVELKTTKSGASMAEALSAAWAQLSEIVCVGLPRAQRGLLLQKPIEAKAELKVDVSF